VAAAERLFVESYVGASGHPLGETFGWYGAYTCVKIAKQLCSVRGVRPHPEGEEALRQVSVMLDQGMAFRDRIG
jgi:hypothetical protein